ncbi:MAG: NUDIX hydrolase [Bacillota bacterium]|jgi:ADP-ribose pyrophosphatase YjhB (NUDIX family)
MTATRDFTVATFVVWQEQVLLLWHQKLQMWLPPGGHIEPNELPDEAAVREVLEESGIHCELVGERPLAVDYPRQLVRPAGIQLETITNEPGHEHIDLIYFARVVAGTNTRPQRNSESERIGWYSLAQMREMDVAQDVLLWAEKSVASVSKMNQAGLSY